MECATLEELEEGDEDDGLFMLPPMSSSSLFASDLLFTTSDLDCEEGIDAVARHVLPGGEWTTRRKTVTNGANTNDETGSAGAQLVADISRATLRDRLREVTHVAEEAVRRSLDKQRLHGMTVDRIVLRDHEHQRYTMLLTNDATRARAKEVSFFHVQSASK